MNGKQTEQTEKTQKKKIEKYTSRTEFAKLETLRSPKTWFLGDALEDA